VHPNWVYRLSPPSVLNNLNPIGPFYFWAMANCQSNTRDCNDKFYSGPRPERLG